MLQSLSVILEAVTNAVAILSHLSCSPGEERLLALTGRTGGFCTLLTGLAFVQLVEAVVYQEPAHK